MCTRRFWALAPCVSVLLLCGSLAAQGIVVPGVGPINRSMAGAAVAAPLDAAGAIHWNPASISGLESSQMLIGVEFVYPRTELTSTVPPNSIAPGFPPVPLSGTNLSQSGISTLPTMAVVYRPEESPLTFGVGLFTIGGFGVNYPGSLANPVLSPPPPNGLGVGPVSSNLALAQFAPTVAVQLSERLSIGFAPTFSVASLYVDPATFAAPLDTNGDGIATYPSATNDRLRWGLGFQTGIYLTTESCLDFGFSFKSPQWFETFDYDAADERGLPRQIGLNVDFPMILSVGTAYRGFERTLWALDVRWVDYQGTQGLGDTAGFDANGAVTGFGWRSSIAVATGVQHELSERLRVRGGYLFADNPVPGEAITFNVASSAIYEHAIFLGGSLKMTSSMTFSVAYYHAFHTDLWGPLQTPLGPIPGAEVVINQEIDAAVAGLHVDF